MSDIPKSERSESPLRAQHMIYNIRKRITAELMATFGYSQKRFEKHIKAVTAYVVNEEEREELAAKIREQEEDFNLWFIQQERARVLTFCQDISVHMRAANTIWPDYWSEYEERRLQWDKAMECCNMLQDELQYIVDIGNQVSQDVGIVHPYRIDNYISIVMGCKLFGRYTDDTHIISDSKEFLLTVLEGVRQIAEEYGIIINEKKTRICKLSSFYRYLQIGYSLTDTGRVIRKIHPKAVTRERRKLKAYKRKLDAGEMSYFDVENSFKSWLGGNWKRMSRQQISNMSLLYYQLFGRRPTWKKGHSRLRWLMGQPWRDSPSTATTTSATRKSPRTSSGTTSAK